MSGPAHPTCYTANVLPTAGAILRFEMQPLRKRHNPSQTSDSWGISSMYAPGPATPPPWDGSHMAVCQNLVPLVNIKIAGKWMFIPLKMYL